MSSFNVPWKVRSALLALLTDDFVVRICRRLPSRKNIVLHIIGTFHSTERTLDLVAKWFQRPGIAHEAQVLLDAYTRRIHVPCIIGSTAHVLLLQHIPGQNLCDLITANPASHYGTLLGKWLAKYHEAFQRGDNPSTVLLKGDARVRNFILDGSKIIGVDFEECISGHYLEDLASACASVLDTNPLFTPRKLALCRSLLEEYSITRGMGSTSNLFKEIIPYVLQTLKLTAIRRGNPPALVKCINKLGAGEFQF